MATLPGRVVSGQFRILWSSPASPMKYTNNKQARDAYFAAPGTVPSKAGSAPLSLSGVNLEPFCPKGKDSSFVPCSHPRVPAFRGGHVSGKESHVGRPTVGLSSDTKSGVPRAGVVPGLCRAVGEASRAAWFETPSWWPAALGWMLGLDGGDPKCQTGCGFGPGFSTSTSSVVQSSRDLFRNRFLCNSYRFI